MPDYLSNRRRSSRGRDQVDDLAGYERDLARLEATPFWEGTRAFLGLWPHQREAVATACAYLRSDKALADGKPEAALLKLPTGAGKSGVIAVLSRCLDEVRRVLVLTPRDALTDQLKDDIAFRFWESLGATVETTPWTGAGVEPATVDRLLPNTADLTRIGGLAVDDRLVLVGTVQALNRIRTRRDRLQQDLRRDRINEAGLAELLILERALAQLRTFDLIVFDEGHYEPAPGWSRSIRELERPTLLLSATPFRNDYKLFRVKGRFVYNLPFADARDARIIRDVQLSALGTTGARIAVDAGRPDDTTEDPEAPENPAVLAEERSAIRDFAEVLARTAPRLLAESGVEGGKVIVRGGSFAILQLLQSELAACVGELPVLVHDRVGKSDDDRRQYKRVPIARRRNPGAVWWVHQTKLLEGIDEPRFVVAAIFDAFRNARHLVQQVGRVLRSTDPLRQAAQTAHVLVPRHALEDARAAWAGYLAFEDYAAEGLDRIVPSEAYLPETIVPLLPDLQYVGGRFRQRVPDTVSLSADDLQLPQRAAVFAKRDSFEQGVAVREIEEGLNESNRFLIRRIEGMPGEAFGWTYFMVDETPFLTRHFLTEWRFGLTVVAPTPDHVFVYDSEGLTFQSARADLVRPTPEEFAKLLPADAVITQVSARSLDMSDRAIRFLSQRTRSFADTFSDLLDPVLRPSALTGYIGPVGRYLGISRRKVADTADALVSISDYCNWAAGISSQLSNRAVQPNAVFARYAQACDVADEAAKAPTNILLDLSDEGRGDVDPLDPARDGAPPRGQIAYDDACVDIIDGNFSLIALDGTEVQASIDFDVDSRRYTLTSRDLNERHRARTTAGGRHVPITEDINRNQSFRLLTGDPSVVYMYGEFLKTRDVLTSTGEVRALEFVTAIPELRATTSEKGEGFLADDARWRAESLFGLIKTYCERPGPGGDNALEVALRDFDLVLLDDDGVELGDFIAIGERRVAIIHAKASAAMSTESVTALQAVGRQAVASLAFCSAMASVDKIADDRFARATMFNQVPVDLSRVFRNERGIPADQISAAVRRTLANLSANREVWIVAGRLFDVDHAQIKAVAGDLSNHQRQLFMFLESLNTACGRANARLRLFAHGS